MKFSMIHENYNVADLDVSIAFYEKALGLKECRRKTAADGSFILVYMKNRGSPSKSKNTMTFEELEALEKAEKSERKSKRAPEVAPSTERKKYTGKK